MIKVIMYYQNEDNTQDYCEPFYKNLFVKDEEEFWRKYNSNLRYVKCEDEFGGAFSVYLKKDKIIEIWIEKVMED